MLISRDSYLIFLNYVGLIISTLVLIDINIFGEYSIMIYGYILFTLIIIYFVFGNIFLLTRKKLMRLYSDGLIELRYSLSSSDDKICDLECRMVDYSDEWYELDKSMFGFNGDMDLGYYQKYLSNINLSSGLFKESELRLGVKRMRQMYDIHKSDYIIFCIIYSIFYIIFSALMFFIFFII